MRKNIDLKRQQGAGTFDEYDFVYGYDNGQTIPYANRTNLVPISKTAIANIDNAYVLCDDTFQAIVEEGYHTYVYYRDVSDFNGSAFLQYLVRNSNDYKLDTDFAKLEEAVVNLIAAGSSVDDVIGEDFDFVNDVSEITLMVGSETLTAVQLTDTSYGFGTPTDGVYPFVLTYTQGDQESLHLDINQTVLASAPLTLKYSEKLVNVPTETGTYTFDTNESAVLNGVDSEGNQVGTITFPVPQVTYTVAAEESSESSSESSTEESSESSSESSSEESSESSSESSTEESSESSSESISGESSESSSESSSEESSESSSETSSEESSAASEQSSEEDSSSISEDSSGTEPNTSVPETGDDQPVLWFVMLLISLTALTGVMSERKKAR